MSVVRGQVLKNADRIELKIDDVALELLDLNTVPTGAALGRAERTTAAAFDRYVGRTVLLQGRQSGRFFVGAKVVEALVLSEHTRSAFRKIEAVLADREAVLRAKPGVIAVRPGYRFRNGWITKEPCIVVTVLKKLPRRALPKITRIPPKIDGIRIDVAPAGPIEQLLATQATTAEGPISADMLANPMQLALPRSEIAESSAGELTTKDATYEPPRGTVLEACSGPMTVVCHVSPDAGWTTLKGFLENTSRRLTVGMHDFTAPHIMRSLESVFSKKGTLHLLLDPLLSPLGGGRGENPNAGDFCKTEVADDLMSKLGGRCRVTWAVAGPQEKSSFLRYNTKVAVRDGDSLWISSGNWQSSNQPHFDPLSGERDRYLPGLQLTYDREWHALVGHEKLAATLEKFIQWDALKAASLKVSPGGGARPDLEIKETSATQATIVRSRFFQPQSFELSKEDSAQPLLSPDNYLDFVVPLLARARRTLFIQNQYIRVAKSPGGNPPKFLELLQVLREKIRAGVDVRIILRDAANPRPMLEALQANGIDVIRRVKLQSACHNKGIIVDGEMVLLGGHDWSGDGTCRHRSASLIFDHSGIAQYYQRVFDYDWENLATAATRSESDMPQLARGSGPVAKGMVRIPWSACFGDDDLASIDGLLDSLMSPKLVPVGANPAVAGLAVRSRQPSSDERARQLADLHAAKSELSQRYLTSEKAVSLTAQARGPSPIPEINVVGVGIGEKITDGKFTNALAVKLFVRIKHAKSSLSPEHLLPTSIAGLPIDIDEVGLLRPLTDPDPHQQYNPAQPGCSVGFEYPPGQNDKMAGTFGAVVRNGAGELFVLSNSHVLAREGLLPKGAPIYQAGLLDLPPGATKRQIATLSDFQPYTAAPLKIDAAIAKALAPNLLSPEILVIGAPQGVANASVDMIVQKFGRSTRNTVGRIVSTTTDVTLPYETGNFTFTEQIMIEGLNGSLFADGGDSGALVLERSTNMAVGLIFGGSSTHVVANHLTDVLQAFNVTLA
jgi:hypothetical protein